MQINQNGNNGNQGNFTVNNNHREKQTMYGKIIALFTVIMLTSMTTSCIEEDQDGKISIEELELSNMILVNQTSVKIESQDSTIEVYIVTSTYRAEIENGYALITYDDEVTYIYNDEIAYLYDDLKGVSELTCEEETILFYNMDSDQDGIPNKDDPEPCWQN